MRIRRYVSSIRTAAAAEKRERVIEAAARSLREDGLHQIADAMAKSDPRAALDRLVDIFCAFWNRDQAVGRLHEAMATDPEFAQALIGRNERRRKTVNVLIGRIAGKTALPRARRDAVDLIFALTSFAMFAMLRTDRSVEEVCALVKSACHGALGPLLSDASRSGSRPHRPGASRRSR